MKGIVKTIAKTGENNWKDKVLTKWFVQFEDEKNGTLTTGFDESAPPLIGDEIEYDIVDNGYYGAEIKLPRTGGSGGGFGGKKWTPEQVAQQDAVKITCSAIEAGLDLKHYKQFFVDCKSFMLNQDQPKAATTITEKEMGMPEDAPMPTNEALPF